MKLHNCPSLLPPGGDQPDGGKRREGRTKGTEKLPSLLPLSSYAPSSLASISSPPLCPSAPSSLGPFWKLPKRGGGGISTLSRRHLRPLSPPSCHPAPATLSQLNSPLPPFSDGAVEGKRGERGTCSHARTYITREVTDGGLLLPLLFAHGSILLFSDQGRKSNGEVSGTPRRRRAPCGVERRGFPFLFLFLFFLP